LLADNPSLKSRLSKAYDEAYGDARLIARRETGLPEETFPEINPSILSRPLIRIIGPSDGLGDSRGSGPAAVGLE